MTKIIRKTGSVCPVCLKPLPAVLERDGESADVNLSRDCPEHGHFSVPVWRGRPDFEAWSRPKSPPKPLKTETKREKGCPHDCGRCEEHRQHCCAVLLEITDRCNLRCPVCFASSGENQAGENQPDGRPFLPLEEIVRRLNWIHSRNADVVLQISGGEPTLYPELPELVAEASKLFPAVQLNSNGVLLAQKPELAVKLAQAGLSWVFLQFDGCSDDIYLAMRGRALLDVKKAAIESCRKAGLAVVLVPTVARGVNDGDLGNIMDFALANAPLVRGVHIQPMAVMGRNSFEARNTLTMPEVLTALAAQSRGRVRAEHAQAPACEHERCSFHIRYRIRGNELVPLGQSACCTGAAFQQSSCCSPQQGPPMAQAQPEAETNADGVQRSVSSVIRNWQGYSPEEPQEGEDALSRFIRESKSSGFSITCMAFQDAWSMDLDRVQGCCIHVYAPATADKPQRLVPFCAYNLTALDGSPLHRIAAGRSAS